MYDRATETNYHVMRLSMTTAKELLEQDPASRMLGIQLIAASSETSEVSMLVREDMVNGYNICHGGFIFTLADTALAFACCQKGKTVVSTGGTIEYLTPAKLSDELFATAHIVQRSGRKIFCDVKVLNQKSICVALLRGTQAEVRAY